MNLENFYHMIKKISVLFFMPILAFTQSIYVTDYEYPSDLKVYKVGYVISGWGK